MQVITPDAAALERIHSVGTKIIWISGDGPTAEIGARAYISKVGYYTLRDIKPLDIIGSDDPIDTLNILAALENFPSRADYIAALKQRFGKVPDTIYIHKYVRNEAV